MRNLAVMDRTRAARWTFAHALNGWLLGVSAVTVSLAGLGACASSEAVVDAPEPPAGLTRFESLSNLPACEAVLPGTRDELRGLGVDLPGMLAGRAALEPGASGASEGPGAISPGDLTMPSDYHPARTESSDGHAISSVAEITNRDEVVIRRTSEGSDEIKTCRVVGASKPGLGDAAGNACTFADNDEGKVVCGEGFYCQAAGNSCGANPGSRRLSGACAPRPEACHMLFAPVAGCDGEVYGNACLAAGAGVNVFIEFLQEGTDLPVDDSEPDAPAPDPSGAECQYASAQEAATVCGEGAFCQAPDVGICADSAGFEGGVSGTCALRPEVCALIYAPVRGCDGETYQNACTAAGAGVNVAETLPLDVTAQGAF